MVSVCTKFNLSDFSCVYVIIIRVLVEDDITVAWFSKIYSHISFLNPKISGFSVAPTAHVHVIGGGSSI